MGFQIIKQPDGRFAIHSSETDTIVLWDATREEIVEEFAAHAAKQAREKTERLIGFVEAGEPSRAYYQFALTWEEALRDDREHGGEAWRELTAGERTSRG